MKKKLLLLTNLFLLVGCGHNPEKSFTHAGILVNENKTSISFKINMKGNFTYDLEVDGNYLNTETSTTSKLTYLAYNNKWELVKDFSFQYTYGAKNKKAYEYIDIAKLTNLNLSQFSPSYDSNYNAFLFRYSTSLDDDYDDGQFYFKIAKEFPTDDKIKTFYKDGILLDEDD